MQKRSSDAKLLLSWLASAKIDWLNVSKIKAFNFYQQNSDIFYREPAQSLNQEDSESQLCIGLQSLACFNGIEIKIRLQYWREILLVRNGNCKIFLQFLDLSLISHLCSPDIIYR